MTISVLSTLTKLGLAAAVAFVIMGGFAFAGGAEARVPAGQRVTWTAVSCGVEQDAYDQAVKDYQNATTQKQKDAARTAAGNAIDNYYSLNCDSYYGSINFSSSVGEGSRFQSMTVDMSGGFASSDMLSAW